MINVDKFIYDKNDVLEVVNLEVEKHQEHDQSSHGNWASGGSGKFGTPKNVDANKPAGKYKDSELWDNLNPSGAEDSPRIEQLCGVAFNQVNQGEKMMSPDEISKYTDEVMTKYGYGDRVYSLSVGDKTVFNSETSGREAAVSRGMTELLPDGNPLKGKDIPVLCIRKRGTTKPAVLHEIAHIMEGSWKDTSGKAGGGHNEIWYETWHTLLKNEGLTGAANMLSFFVYKPEGTGVINVG